MVTIIVMHCRSQLIITLINVQKDHSFGYMVAITLVQIVIINSYEIQNSLHTVRAIVIILSINYIPLSMTIMEYKMACGVLAITLENIYIVCGVSGRNF